LCQMQNYAVYNPVIYMTIQKHISMKNYKMLEL
jgi:hypothetical protein